MLITDFITGGFGIIDKLIEVHKLNEWAKLVLGFVLTYIVAFSAAAGKALVSHTEPSVAVGYGLLSGAGAVLALFTYNPRTRGIMIVQSTKNMVEMSDYQAEEKTK